MTNENIRFTKAHFVARNGYFYYIDEVSNVLYQKNSNSTTVFTFPILDSIGKPIKCMDFDGRYFWTLQEGDTDRDIVIKKYYESNYVIHLEEELPFYSNLDHYFDVDTFALEFYNTTLSEPIFKDDTSLSILHYSEKVVPGTVVTIGPNSEGDYENVTVTGTLNDDNLLGLDFFTMKDYAIGTDIYFTTNIWLLNKYAFHIVNGGALYQVRLPQQEIVSVTVDEDFAAITASCFYSTLTNSYIIMVWNNSLRFLNSTSLVVDKTMVLDNIKVDNATIIPIVGLQLDGDTLFRLQASASYFGEDFDFGTFNFQVSPLRPFIDSVSIDVLPKILPANGINIADVEAVVKDQYGAPIQLKPVKFIDTDSVGFLTIAERYTNLAGTAKTYYKAGIVPNTVFITATATQYD